MSKLISFTRYWLPAIIWMIIIFMLSSKQRLKVSDEYVLNFLFFKTLHLLEYSFLYFLLFRGFYSLKMKQLPLQKKYIYAISAAVLYAASDEIHQTFVPTREGTVRDVLIDTSAILLMYSYIKYNLSFVKKFI